MRPNSRIFIVGHNDSVENSLRAYFKSQRFSQVVSNSQDNIDVLSKVKLETFFKKFKPEFIFLGSLRSGGIAANQQFPAEFLFENAQSQSLVIDAAHRWKTKKLLYFSSSCVYPKEAKQPIQETSLLTGPIEETSGAYAVAKIAGMRLVQAYRAQYGFKGIVTVPATLYGPGSDTDIQTAHVLGALIAKFYEATQENAKEIVLWGTGKPRREFLFVDDFVGACLYLMEKYDGAEVLNMGYGYDVIIKELAEMIKDVSGYKGKIKFDATKPDGAMRKLLDSLRIKKLGWKPKVSLEDGIARTYRWYLDQKKGRG